MDEKVFREKSLQKVKSPDHLSEYIQVANPGVWVLMAAILCLLVGMLCWGIFGNIRTEYSVNAFCDDGVIVCRLTDEQAAHVQPGMEAKLEGMDAVITEVRTAADGNSTCTLTVEESIPDGAYDVVITVENIHPMFLLTN